MTVTTQHDPPSAADPPPGDAEPDPADLGAMFDAYARDLLRYAGRRVGEQVAEDVVAQTFLIAYEQRHRHDATRGPMLPWLYGICGNLLRRHQRTEVRALRAVAAAQSHAADEDAPDARSAERVDAQRTVARVATALAKLPRRQREVLLLFAVADLEYAEIAQALGIPLGSVQSALHRARTKIKSALSAPGGPR
ncbi:DNA-directed RNA polymerase sigma-70 factor [Catellatospora methionotrophica]|uniref:DNA-directed RNA polymerase sigma-70 factor n=1 Tax=Catellatospora methionotrophica TaxID=121620 RepID=A0A8J3LCZ4_9ACTN|nr:sigma-70 family RNA polymerase sigma factor [Catellatospora methionotrophica]GIG16274.1 DNA-directed RNA polymerase sigma-70 factor [Catellatospora methionotrophica]